MSKKSSARRAPAVAPEPVAEATIVDQTDAALVATAETTVTAGIAVVGLDDEHPSDADEQAVADSLYVVDDDANSDVLLDADESDELTETVLADLEITTESAEADLANSLHELSDEEIAARIAALGSPLQSAPEPAPTAAAPTLPPAPSDGSTPAPTALEGHSYPLDAAAAKHAAAGNAPLAAAARARSEKLSTTVGSRTNRYSLTDRIVVLVQNPKRPGTAGHERYEVYTDGMVVEDYIRHEAIGHFGRADLSWDLARGHICIVPADEVATTIKKRDEYRAREAAALASKLRR